MKKSNETIFDRIKRALILFSLTITLILAFTQCRKENCKKHSKWDNCELIDCSYEYNPVCGCDGKTYQNECVAQCGEGINEYSKGECK